MSTVLMIISLLGGLAMFLYGMEIMGDGLKQGSGPALKNFLGKLTHNVVLGLLTGTIVTAIIQSSTATIVLTVGLIGAGILNLRQAVSIVMGANIGTTVTAQIIRLMDIDAGGNVLLLFFKPSTLAPLALIAGIILIMFIKKGNTKNIGMIFMGFGILFSGLMAMTSAVEPLSESQKFADLLSYFSNMPVIGIFTGLILTVIVQSSSAMVGILQALSSTGVMTFDLIIPSSRASTRTCVTTAMVCSIGSSKDAKRTGVVHIVFNCAGTILFMLVMEILRNAGAFSGLWNSIADSGVIANFQTLFNLITAILLVPFTNVLVKIACRIVKDDPVPEVEEYPEVAALDRKLMISPAVALAGTTKAVVTVATLAKENVRASLAQFKTYNADCSTDIYQCEDRIDRFTDMCDNYLIELSQNVETERDRRQLNMLMQCIRDIERIGDYATNFDEMAKKLNDAELRFLRQRPAGDGHPRGRHPGDPAVDRRCPGARRRRHRPAHRAAGGGHRRYGPAAEKAAHRPAVSGHLFHPVRHRLYGRADPPGTSGGPVLQHRHDDVGPQQRGHHEQPPRLPPRAPCLRRPVVSGRAGRAAQGVSCPAAAN